MRIIADILRKKTGPFNIIDPHARVIDALQMMNAVNLSYLIVMDGDNLCGVFSERDYSRNVILKGLHSDSCLVKEVMNTSLPTVDINDTVERCMHLLNTYGTRYLLVLDNSSFKGVVTINDVLREAIANKEMVFDEPVIKESTQDKIY